MLYEEFSYSETTKKWTTFFAFALVALLVGVFLFCFDWKREEHHGPDKSEVNESMRIKFGEAGIDPPETRGQKLFLDHVKSRLKHRLTSVTVPTADGGKKVLTADEAAKHIAANMADEKLLTQGKLVGATPEGPILGLFDRLLQFISDHQEQIEALIEWAFSLLKMIPFPLPI
jgi:hypothetical protein